MCDTVSSLPVVFLLPVDLAWFWNSTNTSIDLMTEKCVFLLTPCVCTVGDCYMGVGGLFDRHHDHAQAVVAFGLDVHNAVRRINQETGSGISIRVGINTGPVVAGLLYLLFRLYCGQVPST